MPLQLFLLTIALLFASGNVRSAQIILKDTVWGPGTVELDQEVQVEHGVTLSVAPGTVIEGNGNRVLLLGELDVRGEDQNTILNDVEITFFSNSNTPGHLNLTSVQVIGGRILSGGYGSFEVKDSLLESVRGFYIWYPTSDSSFRRNVFKASDGLSIGLNRTSLEITNNLFIEQASTANSNGAVAILNWANYGDSLLVENNSFESIDRVALALPSGYDSARMNAQNNYFGTKDKNVIRAMITDRNDGLEYASIIDYEPFLSTPHVDTPKSDFDNADLDPIQDKSRQPIILEDTVWGPGTVELDQEVQVEHGVTLSVAPGTVIEGNGNRVLLLGELDVRGEDQNTILNDVEITFFSNSNTPGHLNLTSVQVIGGRILSGGYGSFEVKDSLLESVRGFYIWYPTSDSSFRRNVFKASDGLSIGLNRTSLEITNNLFIEQASTANSNGAVAILNWANYGDSLLVENNSFESIDRVALALPSGYDSARMNAQNNYFGTKDKNVIRAMITDRNDGLEYASIIDYEPFLSTPHVDTPTYHADSDGDGVRDNFDLFPLDPREAADIDGDGIGDNGDNCIAISNTNQKDLDGDGLGDSCDADDDNDGVLDYRDGFPLIALGGLTDTDSDGRPDDCNLDCRGLGMSADLDDDGDGMSDALELANSLNPLDGEDCPFWYCSSVPTAITLVASSAFDFDGDGLARAQEESVGTNWRLADSDGDGLTDGDEFSRSSNPLSTDSDGDGLSDSREVELGTSPILADTDGDSMADSEEVAEGLSPTDGSDCPRWYCGGLNLPAIIGIGTN